MTTEEYKATPEQWAHQETWLDQNDADAACILELRARVETLERRCEVQLMQLSDLQDRHHRLTLRVGHLECELVRDEDDLPQQHCLEAMDPPEANSQPTPNDRQIRTSLVKRVHSCIVGEPPVGHMQARSVIREVAAWLRENYPRREGYGGTAWANLIEVEASHD
jgi:hypothetical protein